MVSIQKDIDIYYFLNFCLKFFQKNIATRNIPVIFNTENIHVLICLDPLESLGNTLLNPISGCLNTTYIFVINNRRLTKFNYSAQAVGSTL